MTLIVRDQMLYFFKSCYYHVCELRCVRPYTDCKLDTTIATCRSL